MGLYLVGEEAYLRGISEFRLFTRVCSMSENMVGSRNNMCWHHRTILDFSFLEAFLDGPSAPSPCTQTLFTYSIFILFIFLCKYNHKIDHKSKSNGNYTKLTNKQKNYCKYRRTKRYEKLSMELQVQILPCKEI